MFGITWFIHEPKCLWIKFLPLELGHSSKFSEDRRFKKCIQSPRWPFLITVNKLQIDELAECFNRFFWERFSINRFTAHQGFAGFGVHCFADTLDCYKFIVESHLERWLQKTALNLISPGPLQAFLGLISSMNSNRAKTWYRTEKEMTSNNIRVKQVQTSKQSQVGPGEHTDWSPQNSCGAWSHMLYVINVHNAEGVKKSSRECVKAGKIAISRWIEKSESISRWR